MKRCLIFGAGQVEDYTALGEQLKNDAWDYVICADNGYNHAQRLGIPCDLLLGDFDSFQGELPQDIPVLRSPSHKDDTDTMLAVKTALEKGFEHLLLVGMLGGRLDHTLANIQALSYLVEVGATGEIISENTWMTAIRNTAYTLQPREGWYLSVFSLSDESRGVYIRGAEYPLTNALVKNTFPIGTSNAFLQGPATVSVEEGILILMCCKKND